MATVMRWMDEIFSMDLTNCITFFNWNMPPALNCNRTAINRMWIKTIK